MKFTVGEAMCDLSHYIPLVQAAEEAGFSSFSLADSIFYPEKAVGDYPYTPTGDRSFLEGVPYIDPFQHIAMLAAVTERIHFQTGVLKLPIRNPLLVAKQVSSLAVLTEERFHLGVGLSPWVEDFEGTGTDWKSRGPRMDEMIQIIRGFMTGDYFSWKSEHYDIPSSKLCPTPSVCPPIIIGGHSQPAFRRAARYADGFNFLANSEEELAQDIHTIRKLRTEYGRDNEPFTIVAALATVQTLDDVRRMEDLGVTDFRVGYRNIYEPDRMTVQQKVDWVRSYGDQIIAKF